MLQTNQVVQADNMNDKCVGQLVGLASRDQIRIPMRAIRGPHKVKIPSVRIKGEAVAVENRLIVKNEWQPLWPFPGPRVQTVEHVHQTFDVLAGARVANVQIASQAAASNSRCQA